MFQGKKDHEPDVGEFISAMAAGNNAKLMVMVSTTINTSTALALVAAAHQTGGRVICITPELVITSKDDDGDGRIEEPHSNSIEFVVGDAKKLLKNEYKCADFVLIDCNLDNFKDVFKSAQSCPNSKVIVGYNATHKRSSWSDFKAQFLPIGDGLVVTRTAAVRGGGGKRSRWVVTVDKCTGEEHVFRITSPMHN